MAATFRIQFSSETPVERAVEQLAGVDGVVWVEPNRWRETYVVPNDPSFPAPIYATLVEVEGEEGHSLIWSRPNRD